MNAFFEQSSCLKTLTKAKDGPKKQSCIPMVNCFTPAVRSWKYWGVLISYVVIHMHGSFFPDVGPLACVEIPSLGVADCKAGLPAGAWYQLWRWFRELMILVANYLVPPCPWLSSKKKEEMLQGTNSDIIYQASTWSICWDNRTSSRKDAPSTLKINCLVLAN